MKERKYVELEDGDRFLINPHSKLAYMVDSKYFASCMSSDSQIAAVHVSVKKYSDNDDDSSLDIFPGESNVVEVQLKTTLLSVKGDDWQEYRPEAKKADGPEEVAKEDTDIINEDPLGR